MKKVIVGMILLIPLFSWTQNLSPDNFHQPISHVDPDSHQPWSANHTSVGNCNSDMFLFLYKNFYKFDLSCDLVNHGNDHQFYFGYPNEGSYAAEIIGSTFCFEYKGTVWYFMDEKNSAKTGDFECFARIVYPPKGDTNVRTCYLTFSGKKQLLKKAGFQYDTTVIFLSQYIDNTNPKYRKWCLQQYTFDTATQNLVYIQSFDCNNLVGDNIGGVVMRNDAYGNQYFMINSYSLNVSYLGMLFIWKDTQTGLLVCDYQAFHPTTLAGCASTTLLCGSMKGSRTAGNVLHPELSDRITMIGIKSTKSGDNQYHALYAEYYFQNDQPVLATTGEIVIPSGKYPSNPNYLINAYQLYSKDYSTSLPGNDAFQRTNWFFYPNGSYPYITGVSLLSDIWRPMDTAVISSPDLEDDSLYGQPVKSLWTLVGVVEGAPPASINWEKWAQHYPQTSVPSKMVFTVEKVSECEVTTTAEDKYTIGGSMKAGAEIEGIGLESEYKMSYSYSQKSRESSKRTFSKKIEMEFPLDEEKQKFGQFLYMIPTINRYTYKIYPWYDNTWTYPVPNSRQYLMKVVNMGVYAKPVNLHIAPFFINDPNGEGLHDWKSTSRAEMWNSITSSPVQSTIPTYWNYQTGTGGGELSLNTTLSSSTETTSSYSMKMSVGISVPAVFSIGASYGQEISYTTEVGSSTSFGTEMTAKYVDLTDTSSGPNMISVYTNVYWLLPEQNPGGWWYYNHLGGLKPWYIGYIVQSCYSVISLETPGDGDRVTGSDMIFRWREEGDAIDTYTLIIATAPDLYPAQQVYNADIGYLHSITPAGFKPEKGRTYYWAVRGLCSNKDIIWSEIKSFTIPDDGIPGGEDPAIHAVVYPNPAGSDDDVHFTLDQKEPGFVEVRLSGPAGNEVGRYIPGYCDAGIHKIKLPELKLGPGVYFLEIRSGSSRIIKKLVIMNK